MGVLRFLVEGDHSTSISVGRGEMEKGSKVFQDFLGGIF
jgi:hypothetical protein